MKKAKMLYFRELGDERGKLVAIENNEQIPFKVKRVFYIYGSDQDVIRGRHANKESEFVLINVSGESKVKIYNGKEEEIFVLDSPDKGLYIPSLVWKDMYDFSEDSVLLVLASEKYNKEEYINDFEDYLKIYDELMIEN